MKKWVPLIAFLPWILFFAIPIAALFFGVHFSSEMSEATLFAELFDILLLQKVGFTIAQAGVVSIFSVTLGIPLGWILRYSPRATSWLRAPFGIPTLVAAAAWISILSGSRISYSFWSVFIAHLVFNIPWVACSVSQASSQISVALDEQAESLGARWYQRWQMVYYPTVGPAVLSSASQVFVFCSVSFALVMLLGGGPPVETLETAIYSSIKSGAFDLNQARATAVWQLIVSILPGLWIQFLLPKDAPRFQFQSKDQFRKSEPFWHTLVALFWVVPYLVFLKDVQWSVFLEGRFWRQVHQPLLTSLGLSILVSGLSLIWAALMVSGFSAIASARIRRIVEAMVLIPAGISTLTLGLSFWIAYSNWVDPFEGSLVAIILIQAFFFFPIVFRWIWPLINRSKSSLYESALSLGASPARAWWEAEWPRLKAPLAHCFFLVCAASLGELAIVSFFSSGDLVTLPLVISRWMMQYQFEYANAAAVLLLLGAVALARGSITERS